MSGSFRISTLTLVVFLVSLLAACGGNKILVLYEGDRRPTEEISKIDIGKPTIYAVSYTHLTLPTN